MGEAPERIYLDGDVEAGDGIFPRCFENPKYVSEPPVEYVRADRIEELEAKLAKAENLLVDAMVQLENGKIKTRRNRAYLIGQFLAELKGEQDDPT